MFPATNLGPAVCRLVLAGQRFQVQWPQEPSETTQAYTAQVHRATREAGCAGQGPCRSSRTCEHVAAAGMSPLAPGWGALVLSGSLLAAEQRGRLGEGMLTAAEGLEDPAGKCGKPAPALL